MNLAGNVHGTWRLEATAPSNEGSKESSVRKTLTRRETRLNVQDLAGIYDSPEDAEEFERNVEQGIPKPVALQSMISHNRSS
jgi:hypothetical protein